LLVIAHSLARRLTAAILPALLVFLAVSGYASRADRLWNDADDRPSKAAIMRLGKSPVGQAIETRLQPLGRDDSAQVTDAPTVVAASAEPLQPSAGHAATLSAASFAPPDLLVAPTHLGRGPPTQH
jgi:hypothetical protein